MHTYINFNGNVLNSNKVFISPNNRSFRYADGFFETMKFRSGRIILQDFHIQRLYSTLEKLKFDVSRFPDADAFLKQVERIVIKNKLSQARIRCTFFRGNGSLHEACDNYANYLIQSNELNSENDFLNDQGFVVDFYTKSRKSADELSALKSNNFLPYVMGALHAKENGINDCILLNCFGNIADATIANVFIVNNGTIITPPLSDGPVAGVMRKYLLKCITEDGIPVSESSITPDDVMNATEVFLTNAIYGIRWIRKINASAYTFHMAVYLHKKFVRPLFNAT